MAGGKENGDGTGGNFEWVLGIEDEYGGETKYIGWNDENLNRRADMRVWKRKNGLYVADVRIHDDAQEDGLSCVRLFLGFDKEGGYCGG